MIPHGVPTEQERKQIAKWMIEAKPVTKTTTWVEQRLAIDFGGHTYFITDGQIFQCAHCGHYDPEWSATKVLSYFKDLMGIKPYEIAVTCTVAVVEDSE